MFRVETQGDLFWAFVTFLLAEEEPGEGRLDLNETCAEVSGGVSAAPDPEEKDDLPVDNGTQKE